MKMDEYEWRLLVLCVFWWTAAVSDLRSRTIPIYLPVFFFAAAVVTNVCLPTSIDPKQLWTGAVPGGSERVLERAERAGACRARTGIAVEAGDAGIFCVPFIDLAGDKSFDVSVVKECRIELDKPPCRRTVRLPGGLPIIQGRYTPSRF